MNNFNKKILIIAPQFKSIPSNSGGVEGLITDLINENEIQHKAYLFVVSKCPRNNKHYLNTKILYHKGEQKLLVKPYYIGYVLSHFFWKIVTNRLTKKIFNQSIFNAFEDNYFGYYCYRIALKTKPNSIILFGYDKIHHFWRMVKKIGSQNIYYHIHYCREENYLIRKLIPNTIATSYYVFNKWNKTHIKNERSVVIPHGIDFKKFHYEYDDITIESKRKLLGLSKTDFVIIFAGRFRPGKGILELLYAFEQVKIENIKLLILGDFDRKSSDETQFEQSVNEMISNNHRIVRLGFVPNSDISLYYSCADVQVVPTVYEEAAGLVAIEGMLAGLPIIITKSGGMPEYVDDNCSIKLSINNSLSKNIARAIIKLYNEPELRRQMGTNSKKCASKYSIAVYYNNLISFLLKNSD